MTLIVDIFMELFPEKIFQESDKECPVCKSKLIESGYGEGDPITDFDCKECGFHHHVLNYGDKEGENKNEN